MSILLWQACSDGSNTLTSRPAQCLFPTYIPQAPTYISPHFSPASPTSGLAVSPEAQAAVAKYLPQPPTREGVSGVHPLLSLHLSPSLLYLTSGFLKERYQFMSEMLGNKEAMISDQLSDLVAGESENCISCRHVSHTTGRDGG